MLGDFLKTAADSPGLGVANTSMVIPGGLFLAACGILTYHHTSQEAYEHSLSAFLTTICFQMVPLAALKMKIYSCGDRLALVPRVIVKTLLMHLILAMFRIAPALQPEYFDVYSVLMWVDVLAFIVCLVLLKSVFDFPFTLRSFLDEVEVRNLCLMALLGAAVTEVGCTMLPAHWLSDGTRLYIQDGDLGGKVIFTTANYIDVLAFVPVVWKLYQAEENDDTSSGTQVHEGARKQVLLFCGFVVSFYAWDDVLDPLRSYDQQETIAMMAHAAHFVLVCDFALFFIFQVWTPSNQKGDHEMQGLLSAVDEFDP